MAFLGTLELCGSLTCEVEGFTLLARCEYDMNREPPWKNEDGHGVVTGWVTRPKRPGERVLQTEAGLTRYYDVPTSMLVARRGHWGLPKAEAPTFPSDDLAMTPEQITAAAVDADFKRLKGWADRRWSYVGVVLSVSRSGILLDARAASVWGVESDADGLTQIANELIEEAVATGRDVLKRLLPAKAQSPDGYLVEQETYTLLRTVMDRLYNDRLLSGDQRRDLANTLNTLIGQFIPV